MPTAPEGGTQGGATSPTNEFTAITTQADFDKAIGERVTRERAKFADYADLKIKAAELDSIKATNQTEAEKTAKRIDGLEHELKQTRLETLRLKIAGDHKITDAEDIALFLTGTDEEALTKQAKRLADRVADLKKNAPRVPKEGTTAEPKDDGMASFARNLFNSGD
jgi:hypothetical protein